MSSRVDNLNKKLYNNEVNNSYKNKKYVLKYKQMIFTKVSEAVVGHVNSTVYELDASHQVEFETALREKIRSMRIHRGIVDEISSMLAPNATADFKASIESYQREANNPMNNSRIQLDVRRSRVTEFMSEMLLEKQHGCLFYESTNKRINLPPYDADKHVSGIDVTGLLKQNDSFKFVVCEVKSSSQETRSGVGVDKLVDEIRDAYDDKNGTLGREIKATIQQIQDEASIDSTEISNIIRFLTEALAARGTKEVILNRIIFFPFLVKQNAGGNPVDASVELHKFSSEEFNGAELHGVIWSFGKTLDEFCHEIYESAVTS